MKIMEEALFKTGERVPAPGRYQCVVCGFVIEFVQHHIDRGVTFLTCSVCHAGTEGGPKAPHEDVWKAL